MKWRTRMDGLADWIGIMCGVRVVVSCISDHGVTS